jgi:hypothetical protein
MHSNSLFYGMEMVEYRKNSSLISCLVFKCKFSHTCFLFIVYVEGGSKINIVFLKISIHM